MDANTQIEKLVSSISSLNETLINLQSHADNLHQSHEDYINHVSENVSTSNPEIESHINHIKNAVIQRSDYLQDIINNTLHPDVIQQRIDNIRKIEERKKYWMDEMNKRIINDDN